MAKRLFDLVCAVAGLLLLSPLLLGIALWIKLDSAGPVFFRQQRIGRFGVPFRIHKFRTMRDDARAASRAASCADPSAGPSADPSADPSAGANASAGPPANPAALSSQLTVGADPRITRAGRSLRAAKLDELPQLLDVLVGTMSLVGPRPEVPRYVALYPAALRDKVLSVLPGITDPASIEYRDEAALLATAVDPERMYVEKVMPAKLRSAARYVDERSLLGDLRVIAATLRALWMRP